MAFFHLLLDTALTFPGVASVRCSSYHPVVTLWAYWPGILCPWTLGSVPLPLLTQPTIFNHSYLVQWVRNSGTILKFCLEFCFYPFLPRPSARPLFPTTPKTEFILTTFSFLGGRETRHDNHFGIYSRILKAV